MKKYWYKFPLLLCYLIAIAFSIKNLREPDLWWQLRTGQWILQHHTVPKADVFSYTYSGTAWINIKWGFEVLAALVAAVSGPESIFVLQAIIACSIVFFLAKAARQFSEKQGPPLNPPKGALIQAPKSPKGTLIQKSSSLSFGEGRGEEAVKAPFGGLGAVIALLCTLFTIEYRMIGRPEMFTHFFTIVFLYLLMRHRSAPSYRVLILIPLQLIWANFHEAFAIGIILTAIFVSGGWIEYYLSKRKLLFAKATQPKELTIALLAMIAVVAINPNGTQLLTRPFAIMGQIYQNKFTTENAGFGSYLFWQWNSYLSTAVLALGAIGIAVYYRGIKTKSSRLKLFAEHFGAGYLLTIVAFVYLAATAYRNIALLMLVFFPALVYGVNAIVNKIAVLEKYSTQVIAAIAVLQLGIYAFIISDRYYELTGSHDRYGLEVCSTFNPVGAAGYVAQQRLKGRCFSDYQTSSYLLWRLQPDFKTYIDLRDLDVFPPEFFFTFAAAVNDPDEFDRQDSIYHFGYVVLYRPQFPALHQYLYGHSRFRLAFVDPVAAVYVPKESADTQAARFMRPGPVPSSALSFAISRLFNPFYRPFDYSSVDCDLLASAYYVSVGRLADAEKYTRHSYADGKDKHIALKMLGDIYYQKSRLAPGANGKTQLLDSAMLFFQQSVGLNKDYADAWLGQGAIYYEQANMAKALDCFEQCISLDNENLTAYLSAGNCCNYFINNNTDADSYTKRGIGFYEKANRLNPDNPSILLTLGFLYVRQNDCGHVSKYLGKIAGYPGLSDLQRSQIRQCLDRCGK